MLVGTSGPLPQLGWDSDKTKFGMPGGQGANDRFSVSHRQWWRPLPNPGVQPFPGHHWRDRKPFGAPLGAIFRRRADITIPLSFLKGQKSFKKDTWWGPLSVHLRPPGCPNIGL